MFGPVILACSNVFPTWSTEPDFAILFDPLGLICPVTVEMKLLFQDVCRAKLKWDGCLTTEFQKRWEMVCLHLEHLNEILINRCYVMICWIIQS